MSARAGPFRQSDLVRVFRAAEQSKLHVDRMETDPATGRIVFVFRREGIAESLPDGTSDTADRAAEWFEDD